MAREIDWQPYYAWWPTVLEDGSFAWLRWIERRKWWIGPRTTATGDPDLMRWHYRAAGQA